MMLKRMMMFLLSVAMLNGVFAQTGTSAADIMLKEACKKAAKENKNVIVIFHASWCGWCHKMDSSMNDISTKKMFETNYVTIHFTVDEAKDKKQLETPGADAIRTKYHGEKVGLPFWLIMDKTGKLLADSRVRKPGESLDMPGENMGCPAAKDEVENFLKLLKSTSYLSDKQLEVIGERFRKNE